MKRIYIIALILLLGIVQGAWADTTGGWQDNRDTSWGSDYETSDAFAVNTAAQFAQFAYMVNDGKDFNGKTITLAEDINLSAHFWTPIGTTQYSCFNGAFDGAGHTITGMYINNDSRLYNGLFGYIDGDARIRNLKITDSQINVKSEITGAIVGYAKKGRIENCSVDSSVVITSTAAQSGDGEVIIATGGLVGRLLSSVEIRGCVCGASVNGTEKVGGLVGEVVSARVVACLYTGSHVNGGSSSTQAALFGNINGGDYLFYNLYTNSALDGKNGQDKRGYVISLSSGGTFDFASQAQSNVSYDVSGITYYTYHNWPYTDYSLIIYGGTMYCASGQMIPFTVTTPPGYALASGVSVSAGYEGYIVDTYTLVTAASDCTLSAPTVLTAWNGEGTGTELAPYIIRTPYDLRWIAAYVNAATNDHYSGKYFQLANDITFDGTANNFTAIGNTNSKYFAGTFDGMGHTISGINISADGGQGLFGTVSGATIKNLTLSASTIKSTSTSSAGGIVSNAGNDGVTIENCHVSGNVTIESGNTSGGIIARTTAGYVTITGCTCGATISSRNSGDIGVGGIVGTCGNQTGSLSTVTRITNCLYYGTSLTGHSNYTGGIIGNCYTTSGNIAGQSKVTLSHNFYTYPDASIKGIGFWRMTTGSYNNDQNNYDITDNDDSAIRVHAVTANADIEDMGTPDTPVENGITPYTYGVKYGNAYYSHILALLNNEDNTALINQYNGQTFNVKLRGRTLYKDGSWNTLCLPFAQSNFNGTIFEDATEYEKLELETSRRYHVDGDDAETPKEYKTGCQDGRLYLFFRNANYIEAGKPYIVKWRKVDGYDNHHDPATYDYVEPMFPNVTIVNSSPVTVTSEDGTVSFVSTYAPFNRDYEDRSILFLGISNTLFYPNGAGNVSVKSFRAYFQLNGVLAASDSSGDDEDDDDETYIPGGGEVKVFVMDIEDDATSIQETRFDVQNEEEEWYSLDGIRLNGKPSVSGVYVNGGRKVVIK